MDLLFVPDHKIESFRSVLPQPLATPGSHCTGVWGSYYCICPQDSRNHWRQLCPTDVSVLSPPHLLSQLCEVQQARGICMCQRVD